MSDHIKSSHRKNWYITYSVLLSAILALAVSKEIFNIVFLSRDKQVTLCILQCGRSVALRLHGFGLYCSKLSGNRS